MATVFKRPGSPFWFACYPDRNGKTVRRTTKSTDRAVAARMALEWERVEFAAREGHASVAAFQKVVTEVSEKVIGESLPSQSVRQYFEEWSASIARKNSPGTVERYRNTVRLFLLAIEKAAEQPLRSLTPRHIDIFLNRRLDKGAAPKTAIVDVKTLGAALNRAEHYGYIDKNPVKAVTLPKCVSTEREGFSVEEIHNVVVKGKGTRSFARRTFHSLRHTFSSMLAGHGVSEELRMRLTGHSSRDIHQPYPQHATEALQKAIDAIQTEGR